MNMNKGKKYEIDLGYAGLIAFFLYYILNLILIIVFLKVFDWKEYYDLRQVLVGMLSVYGVLFPVPIIMGSILFIKITSKSPLIKEVSTS